MDIMKDRSEPSGQGGGLGGMKGELDRRVLTSPCRPRLHPMVLQGFHFKYLMYLSQRLFSFKTRAPESMHAVQQGFFPAQTQCLMMCMLKYYVKDWALDEGRTTGFATPRDGSLLMIL